MKSVRFFLFVFLLQFLSFSFVFSSPVFGLPNFGNSCYMNASLQCILQIPEVAQFIESRERINDNEPFYSLCRSVLNASKKNSGELTAKTLDLFRWTGSRFFSGSDEQQDALEFFVKLIDSMPLLRSLFSFSLNVKFTCAGCNAILESVNQRMYDIPLDIFPPDLVDDVLCPNCSLSSTKAYKSCKLNSYPPYLLFDCEKMCGISAFIIMNKLSKISIDKSNYELISVVLHAGSNKEGHYISCVKEFSTGEWYLCDDMKICKLSNLTKEEYDKYCMFSPRILLYTNKKLQKGVF